jgi:hypothetical protein
VKKEREATRDRLLICMARYLLTAVNGAEFWRREIDKEASNLLWMIDADDEDEGKEEQR